MMKTRSRDWKRGGMALGIVLFSVVMGLAPFMDSPQAYRMAAVTLLMATWWISEAVPLFATALLPLVLFPVLGIETGRQTAPIYFNSTIVLFLGGFMIALSMEKWRLHRRMALWIIAAIGSGPQRIILGFMLAGAFLSMWISNTATAIMMLPIGLALVVRLEEEFGEEATRPFATSIMLAIAYACSLGGLVTLVGTPPNLSFVRILQITFPEAPPITFGAWMLMGLPIGAVMLFLVWLLLTRVFFPVPKSLTVGSEVLTSEKSKLGPISFEEKTVLLVFTATALLWVFRVPIRIGSLTVPGWSQYLPYGIMIDDGTVAIAMAALLFILPTRNPKARSETLLDSEVIPRLPWNIVLLFGGGFALAHGIQSTGLSQMIGEQFVGLKGISPFFLVLAICFTITFLTELTSNTATAEMVLPILAAVGVSTGTDPLIFMIPATLAASCAFMMPIATPPNTIIFGSGRVSIPEMARVGLVVNLLGVLVISLSFHFLGTALLGIDPGILPDWAVFAASP